MSEQNKTAAPDAVMASMETETDPLPDTVAAAWDVELDPPAVSTLRAAIWGAMMDIENGYPDLGYETLHRAYNGKYGSSS